MCAHLPLGAASVSKNFAGIDPERFRAEIDGVPVGLFYLKGGDIDACVTNFGGRVVALRAPDKNGALADVVLGRDSIEDYLSGRGERFLGATIGRFGNRIAGGRFSLDGKTYQLPQNNGDNCLHGGLKAFDNVPWRVLYHDAQTLELFYHSPDGEEGFPGALSVYMTYTLRDNNFSVTHRAVSSARTVVNLTHHSFFNLKGAGQGDINDHVLQINASHYDPVDARMIPSTPRGAPVAGTPMDFRSPTAIGARLDEPFEQLTLARGYDHNWILDRATPDGLELAASVYEPVSGRVLEVFTTAPAMQFYGGNFFDGNDRGKGGKIYGFRGSFALETQHYPDAPNRPQTPSTLLEPGAAYFHRCDYRFSVRSS